MALFGLFGKKKKEEPKPTPPPKPELTPEEMYEKGMDLIIDGQYDQAYPLLSKVCKLPEAGEPEPKKDGVAAVGLMLWAGEGCRQNQDEALRYLQWAAERGDPLGMDGVIELAIHQAWTPKDLCQQALEYAEAREKMLGTEEARNRAAILHIRMNDIIDLEIVEELAEKGNVQYQLQVGYRYYEGNDAPKDMEKALYWFEKAAKQGDADAQNFCGQMYYFGEGTSVDRAEAYYWLSKAAVQGNETAAKNCRNMEKSNEQAVRDGTWRLMLSAVAGDEIAMKIVGDALKEEERKCRAELEKYEQAAERGDVEAMKKCADKYHYSGGGALQDYVKALYWYDKLVDLGDTDAFNWCGQMCYEGGHGIDADKAKALAYYKKGAELGEMSSQCEYGLMLVHGEAAAVDREAGRRWIEKAAAQGYGYAQRKLEELFGAPKE